MDNFRIIYKILNVYKDALWKEGVPLDAFIPEKLGTTDIHIRNLHFVLRNAGLIVGTNGNTIITLAGLEYLEKNEQMKAIAGERKP